MVVPLYLDYGKGWVRLGRATVIGTKPVEFNIKLAQMPKQATICAVNDVLAGSINVQKR
jgi:hypothetical protein